MGIEVETKLKLCFFERAWRKDDKPQKEIIRYDILCELHDTRKHPEFVLSKTKNGAIVKVKLDEDKIDEEMKRRIKALPPDSYFRTTKEIVFNMFKNILNSDEFPGLSKASYFSMPACKLKLNDDSYMYVIELNFSNRNFWFESRPQCFGKVVGMPDDKVAKLKEWEIDEVFKYLECAVEIDDFNIDHLTQTRFIISVDGKHLLEEENKITPNEDGTETNSNPEYGKKDFFDVVAKNYYVIKTYLDVKRFGESEDNNKEKGEVR